MSLMTDSKIIHEAQESQQFQQNPQYFHRNVNSYQIYKDINELSSHVNTFVKKFEHSHFSTKNTNDKNKGLIIDKTNIKSISQIDQLAYETQNFIQGLTWVSESRKMSQSKEINKKPESKISFVKQIDSQNSKVKYNLTKNTSSVYQSFSKTLDKKDYKINNSTQIKSFKISQQNLPKTVNILRKNFSSIKNHTNYPLKYISSPFEQKQTHQFQDFDDQDTVINEPTNKVKKKFYKKNTEKDLKSERVRNQAPYKLTKKKLLQKILNLENTVNQLKFQNYQNQLISRKNNIIYVPVQLKSHEQNFTQKINNESANKTLRKYQNNLFNESKSYSQRFCSMDTKDSWNLPKRNNINQINHSQPRAKSSLKNQDRKVSLKKWADQVFW